jgi:hypothetical protein
MNHTKNYLWMANVLDRVDFLNSNKALSFVYLIVHNKCSGIVVNVVYQSQ